MKNLILAICFCMSMTSLTFEKQEFYVVTPDFSYQQISKIEADVLTEYQVKVQIQVLKRNEQNQIIHLVCKRFDKKGEVNAKCESDNFGQLKITKIGCGISDL
ncbi:hypothetical protein GCM10027035_17850 [Emticicia sediminis]